jgi:hypothetical protein
MRLGIGSIGPVISALTTPEYAALYASLCTIGTWGAAETLVLAMAHTLKEAGIGLLNMGGAETKGLFDFKRKFGPIELIATFDMELAQR